MYLADKLLIPVRMNFCKFENWGKKVEIETCNYICFRESGREISTHPSIPPLKASFCGYRTELITFVLSVSMGQFCSHVTILSAIKPIPHLITLTPFD